MQRGDFGTFETDEAIRSRRLRRIFQVNRPFEDGALEAIAEKALERKTGARALNFQAKIQRGYAGKHGAVCLHILFYCPEW